MAEHTGERGDTSPQYCRERPQIQIIHVLLAASGATMQVLSVPPHLVAVRVLPSPSAAHHSPANAMYARAWRSIKTPYCRLSNDTQS